MQKIDLQKLRHETFEELFEEVEKVLSQMEINFYVLGAIARDIWVETIFHSQPKRATKDVDLAVWLSKEEDYELIKNLLISTGMFTSTKEPFTLLYKQQTPLDLLPFGEIETEEGKIKQIQGMSNININGYEEIYHFGLETINTSSGKEFKVCTLAGIVILKLLAYNDRPEIRQKDIQDLAYLCKNYIDFYNAELIDNHYDLFEKENSSINMSARLLGRHIQVILKQTGNLNPLIKDILNNHLDIKHSKMAEILYKELYLDNLQEAFSVIKSLLDGIKDVLP